MNYPFWDIPIGYGLLMAAISILHVFISHFAIGGGLYLVITETIARKRNDTATLQYLEGLSKFFVLTTLVLGALTGVGIWFVIGLLSPAATDLLIHNFVWAWAIEWTFFVIEIAAALFYYYGWKRMSAADHVKIGWIYFVAAWLSPKRQFLGRILKPHLPLIHVLQDRSVYPAGRCLRLHGSHPSPGRSTPFAPSALQQYLGAGRTGGHGTDLLLVLESHPG
jgi:hypothetical protein